ncbi:MAG: hypothetical protein AB8G96_01155 [Phycisphaerales bacterium]
MNLAAWPTHSHSRTSMPLLGARPHRPRRGKTATIVIGSIVGGLLIMGVFCGLGIFLIGRAGLALYVDDAIREANQHPVITHHLGNVTAASVDMMAQEGIDNWDVLNVDLTGSKADGRLIAQFIDQPDGTATLGPGALVLKDGTRLDLATGEPTTGTPWYD